MSDLRWPVSIKGVVTASKHVLLAFNERDEWELPGGRLERDESPVRCVEREVLEETGLQVNADRVVDSWVYQVLADRQVLIVTYQCADLGEIPAVEVSDEHRHLRWVRFEECDDYEMPDGYRRSIAAVGEFWQSP